MTDRVNYLTVALKRDMRIDDAEGLISAIRMLRHVLAVEPHVVEPSDWIANERAAEAVREKLLAIAYPERTT